MRSRPLSGESISYLDHVRLRYYHVRFSSPFGGVYFLSITLTRLEKREPPKVLVPFRGSLFLIFLSRPAIGKSSTKKFSSPFGGVYFLSFRTQCGHSPAVRVLVPFRGSLFLITKTGLTCAPMQSSRPLSGESISYLNVIQIHARHVSVLVPFRGSLFLIQKQSGLLHLLMSMFSSPFGGVYFLSSLAH